MGNEADYRGNPEGYSTCDLYLAAFFLSAGCKIEKSTRDKKTKRVYFLFEKNPLVTELRLKYYSRDAKIDAQTFADNVKSLKSLCHSITNMSLMDDR
jgi:hypothetical protein